MPGTSVLIPYRAGCPHRTRALERVLGWYASVHPAWPVLLGNCGDGPWNKSLAVADALDRTDAGVLIVADADCWTDDLPGAVRAVRDGCAWAIGHRGVHRLTEASTGLYAPGGNLSSLTLAERAYRGVEGGGITVLRRDVYEGCPIDPRFVGWGSEDEAWGWALRTLYGPPWHGKAPLVHLHHPPAPRTSRARGTEENWSLRRRYAHAHRNPIAMRKLIEEVTRDPSSAAEPAGNDRQPVRR